MKVNGKEFPYTELKEKTILSLLAQNKINPDIVAIEKNGEIINRELWKDSNLLETDSLEIIKFVGGG